MNDNQNDTVNDEIQAQLQDYTRLDALSDEMMFAKGFSQNKDRLRALNWSENEIKELEHACAGFAHFARCVAAEVSYRKEHGDACE